MSEMINLVCEETSESLIIDTHHHDGDDDLDDGEIFNWEGEISRKDLNFNKNRSIPMMGFAFPARYDEEDDGESIREMIDKETYFKTGHDEYLIRLRSCGGFELRIRNEAIHWIHKVCDYHNFGPLCVYLSINYFDRFLTSSELPKDKDWFVQLLVVSCLSLAAKMEETNVPQSVDLQVEDPKFVFEAKTIKRMELLVLNTLNWRMRVITPFSFLDYFVEKRSKDHSLENYIYRSSQLILDTTKDIEFLEFKPSEIAAAIAISLSGEAGYNEKTLSSFIHVKKERVGRCLKMMRDLPDKFDRGGRAGALAPHKRVPESPNGVLEAMCLSYKSDDITIGSSCTNSPHNNNNNKRRKLH
ncbi:unnamed protein product [Cochlearia groenlandica]